MEFGWNAQKLFHNDSHSYKLHPQHLLKGMLLVCVPEQVYSSTL